MPLLSPEPGLHLSNVLQVATPGLYKGQSVWISRISFEMVEAEYDVLASRLLDYYNKFSKEAFVPHSVLFRSPTLSSFLDRARSPSESLSKKRRFHASTIWHSP